MRNVAAASLPKSLHRFAATIADYEDERPIGHGNSIHIGLVAGYRSYDGEGHHIVADNVAEAAWELRNVILCTEGCCSTRGPQVDVTASAAGEEATR